MGFPTDRPRRLRRTAALRSMVRETRIQPSDLILPLFAVGGKGVRKPIGSMPGVAQLSVDLIVEEIKAARAAGVRSVILFGIPDHKDAQGAAAWDANGPVCTAFRAIKDAAPDVVAIADVCLCEYTDHGHCGPLARDARGQVAVSNDQTLPLLARAAVAYAQSGADIVAPSDMMDGRVAAIRKGLDEHGLSETAILSYAVKYASAFYGPFREAAESAPKEGDRRGYQMRGGGPHPPLQRVRRRTIPIGSRLIDPPRGRKVLRCRIEGWSMPFTSAEVRSGGNGGEG